MILDLQRYGVLGWHCEVSDTEIKCGGFLIEDLDEINTSEPIELFDIAKLPERVAYRVMLPETIKNKNYSVCLQRSP